MAYHGFCRDRQRHKWRCPLTRKTWKVVCDSPCSHSSYGRVIYTYEKDNLRLFTRTPRGSKAWRKKYKKRTAVERSFKRKKVDYHLEAAKARSTSMWFFRCIVLAMCQHIDAWEADGNWDFRAVIQEWVRESEAMAA